MPFSKREREQKRKHRGYKPWLLFSEHKFPGVSFLKPPRSLPQAGLPTNKSGPAQAAQVPIHPGLEHLQGWGTHSSSGQSVAVPHYPLS